MPTTSTDPTAFELNEVTLTELQRLLHTGKYTSVQITQLYLHRIADIDKPLKLNSVLYVNPALSLQQAAESDRLRAAGTVLGPLHGIPILLKDNISTNDMPTTGGSTALQDHMPYKDAHIVTRLRRNGAIIIGKANLSQFSFARSWSGMSGWSSVGGQCRNPFVLDRSTSGSSSGSAAAVAANLAPTSIGTDTGGSICCPANMCYIVGLRPTTGLVSRSGILPISSTRDTAGPMTRTVGDCAILLTAIAGSDPADPATAEADLHTADFAAHLTSHGLQNKRIGVLRKLFYARPHVVSVFNQAIVDLERCGATIVDNLEFWSDTGGKRVEDQLDDAGNEVMITDFKYDFALYMHEYDPNNRTGIQYIQDVIQYNRQHADIELAVFDQELMEDCINKDSRDSEQYTTAKTTMFDLSRTNGIDALLRKHQLDALVAPTCPVPWLLDEYTEDNYGGISTKLCSAAGYPQITVPSGLADGKLPLGLSFMGGKWQDGQLLQMAYAYEQMTKHRRPPQFIQTLAKQL